MLVSLYTSRVFLQALGAEDYGIYNVVGGFVAMFSIISGALTGAISRFLTFELGRDNPIVLKSVFATSILVLIGLSILVILFGETVGLWFLKHKLVIPENRSVAAFWVFQLALFAFIVNLMVIPYSSCIISHEKMGAFAYISLIEMFAKLIISFAILNSPIDRLIYFSILFALTSLGVSLIYIIYCKKKFLECNGKLKIDFKLLKNMFGFAGWSFIGSSGWILRNQGGTVLLNLFGGPVVNAANAIAFSLSSAANNFVNCFTTSFNPQITKQYASNKFEDLHQLIIRGAKFSFYMLFLIALPIILNTAFILRLWIGDNIPDHTVMFVRLILIISLIDIISVPLITVQNATGDIKKYQIIVGSIQLLSIPLGYIGLKLGASVEWMYIAFILVTIFCFIVRLVLLNESLPLWSSTRFICAVCIKVGVVAIVSSVPPILVSYSLSEGWNNLIITTICSFISCATVIYYIGLTPTERTFIIAKFSTFLHNFIHS